MKSLKSILIAFCCIALFGHVALGADNVKLKTHISYDYQLDASIADVLAVPAAVSFYSLETPICFDKDCFVSKNVQFSFLDKGPPEPAFSDGNNYQNAISSYKTFVPNGSLTYLKRNKPHYKSPIVDDKWKWYFSQMHNC